MISSKTVPLHPSKSAANESPSVPSGTTLFDVIAALQDAADESIEDEQLADMVVCASLVELRHQLVADKDEDLSLVA